MGGTTGDSFCAEIKSAAGAGVCQVDCYGNRHAEGNAQDHQQALPGVAEQGSAGRYSREV